MSFATINSICEVYNKCSFIEYLQITHRWCSNSSTYQFEKSKYTILSLCCSHLMKNISRDIKSYFTNKNHAKIVIEIFSTFFNITNYEVIKDVWKKLCIVLKSPFSTKLVEKTLTYLLLQVTSVYKIKEEDMNLTNSEMGEENEEEINKRDQTKQFHEKNKSLYEQSPYFKEFNEINLETVAEIDEHGGKQNHFYCPQVLICILKKYITYLGLFCGTLNENQQRNSNSNIECYFSKIKRDIQKQRLVYGDRRLRTSEFITLLDNYNSYINKMLQFKIPTSRLASKRNRVLNDSKIIDLTQITVQESINSKEVWSKREKKLSGYFLQKNCKKLLAKLPSQVESIQVSEPSAEGVAKFYSNGNLRNGDIYTKCKITCDR